MSQVIPVVIEGRVSEERIEKFLNDVVNDLVTLYDPDTVESIHIYKTGYYMVFRLPLFSEEILRSYRELKVPLVKEIVGVDYREDAIFEDEIYVCPFCFTEIDRSYVIKNREVAWAGGCTVMYKFKCPKCGAELFEKEECPLVDEF